MTRLSGEVRELREAQELRQAEHEQELQALRAEHSTEIQAIRAEHAEELRAIREDLNHAIEENVGLRRRIRELEKASPSS